MQSIAVLLLMLLLAAAVRPHLSFDTREGGIPTAVYWRAKLGAGSDYDVVVAGDSRVNAAIVPEGARRIGDNRVLSFGIPLVAFNRPYLERLPDLLDPKGRRVIVLGFSTHSMSRKAVALARYSKMRDGEGYSFAALHSGRLLDRFEPFEVDSVRAVWRRIRSRRSEPLTMHVYHDDGWVESWMDPPDPTRAVAEYRDEYLRGNTLDPEVRREVLDHVTRWSRAGFEVVGLRMPVSDQLRRLEDEMVGRVDSSEFITAFEEAGGVWLYNVGPPGAHETYDGSHLHRDAARIFSESLAKEL